MVSQNMAFLLLTRRYEQIEFDYVYYIKFIIAASLFRVGLNVLIAIILSILFYGGVYLSLLILFRTFTNEDFQIFLDIEKRLGVNLGFLKKIIIKFY